RRLLRLEARPVDYARFEVGKVEAGDGRLLVDERRLGMLRPVVGRGDDQPVGEGLLPGGGEEGVDVALLEAVVLVVELALDRVDLARARDRYEVDPDVAGVLALPPRPFGVGKDLLVEVPVGGLVAEVE